MSEETSRAAGHEPRRQPKLLDRVRGAMRVRHMKWATEKAYVGWIRRYILFHGKLAWPQEGMMSPLSPRRCYQI